MNLLQLVTDRYNRVARFLPAVLVVAPLLVLAATAIPVAVGIAGKVVDLAAMAVVEHEASQVETVGRPLREGVSGALWNAAKVLTAASLALSLLPGRSRAKRSREARSAGTCPAAASSASRVSSRTAASRTTATVAARGWLVSRAISPTRLFP